MRPRVVAASIPIASWLVGLVVLSILIRYGVGRRMVAPWIMIDEIVYSELARGIAAGEGLTIRGEHTGLAYGAVYPALISPAYLLDSLTAAYAAVKAINAVLISLAAVPAYFLARRVLTPGYALAAALLTVSVPSLFYAGTIMTENAFYPIVLAAALALVLVLERPTPLRVGAFLAAAGVAYLTRHQAVFLVPAALTAPLLLGWRRLTEFRWLYGGIAAVAALAVAVAAARGDGPLGVLGAYRAATTQDYSAVEIGRWLLYHLGELDLYVGIAPFAAFLLLLFGFRRLEPPERAFVAGATAFTGWLVLQVAAFATQPSVLRIEERNMFYAAPLFFVALLLWIRRGGPRPLPALAAAGAAAVAVPAFIPYERLIGVSATSDTLALLPLWWAHVQGVRLDWMWLVVAVGAGAVVLLVAVLPRQALVALPALVLVLYALAAQPVDARMRQASVGALFQGITNPERDWIDRAVGRDADVAVLWTGAPDRLVVHENEFFSRSVEGIYHLGDPVPGGLAQTPLSINPLDGSFFTPSDAAVTAPYLLVHESIPIAGRVVAADRRKELRLYRLEGPARVTGITVDVYADLWSEPRFTYTGFRCDGSSLVVRLQSDARLFSRPQTVTAQTAGRTFTTVVRQEVDSTTMRIPLEGERCVVRFSVTPTAVPAHVQNTSDDRRTLGIRVTALDRQ